MAAEPENVAWDLFVDCPVYTLGENKFHIRESAAAGRLLSSAADLESAGFEWHYICEPSTSAYDLAKDVTRQLTESGRLGSPDLIVYSTCLPENGNAGDRARWERSADVKHLMDFPASRLQAEFDMDQAVVFGLNQQGCTGMLGSIRLASAMLATEDSWRQALCLSADRFPLGSKYEQAYNLVSDGAAACVVSKAPGRFRVVGAHQITNGGLAAASNDETVGSFFSYSHRLFRETLARCGMSADDVDWLIPQNTNEKAWRILARALAVDLEKVQFPTLGEMGHAISADQIMNLAALVDSGRIRPGQRLALMVAGTGLNYQCLVLEATAAVNP